MTKKTTNIETEYKEIIKPSLNLTLNKLFGSVTAFLEPIIFTYAFLKTGLSTVIADELYAVIYGYSIPIILTTNFISIAIETAILPTLTKLHIENNKKELNNIVKKALLLSFIPAVIISFIYFNFSYEIMEFFYKTTKGAYYIKLMAIPSFFAYFEGVFISLLIATKNEKTLVKNTIFTNILHLLLIYIFVSIPKINALGIIYSFSIVMILSPIVLYCFSVKNTPFSLKKRNLVLFLVIYALFMSLTFLL